MEERSRAQRRERERERERETEKSRCMVSKPGREKDYNNIVLKRGVNK